MGMLSSLLPGFREVRAPLISGYLWLLVFWLAIDPAVPDATSIGLEGDLYEIGNALGRVGIALASSVIAYVLGSLILASFQYFWERIPGIAWRRDPPPPREPTPSSILTDRHFFDPFDLTGLRSDDRIQLGLRNLEMRLEESRRRLEGVVQRCGDRLTITIPNPEAEDADASVHYKDSGASGTFEAHAQNCPLPRYSPARDIFREYSIVQSRLIELDEYVGGKIDRYHSESELRFAIAWPLLAFLVLLIARTDDLVWLVLLPVVGLLIAHGAALHRMANRELLDTLRIRPSEELKKIAPVFDEYERRALGLATLCESLKSSVDQEIGKAARAGKRGASTPLNPP